MSTGGRAISNTRVSGCWPQLLPTRQSSSSTLVGLVGGRERKQVDQHWTAPFSPPPQGLGIRVRERDTHSQTLTPTLSPRPGSCLYITGKCVDGVNTNNFLGKQGRGRERRGSLRNGYLIQERTLAGLVGGCGRKQEDQHWTAPFSSTTPVSPSKTSFGMTIG